MSQLHDLLADVAKPPAETLPRTVLGRAANSVTTPDDDLFITIGSFDGHRQQWGPCEWSPANALPTRGDDVLVVFDESAVPWVIAFTWGSRTSSGVVAAPAPTLPTDPLHVVVDAVPLGPMPWAPREVIPKVGDQVLVFFDEDGQTWALAFSLANRIMAGTSATNCTSPATPLMVNVPGIAGQVGPCPWSPRNVLPQSGDPVLVLFDQNLAPSVIAWTVPATSGLLAHQTFTSGVFFTAPGNQTDGTAQMVVATPSIALSGSPVLVEFYCPYVDFQAASPQPYNLCLYRDSTIVHSRWGVLMGQLNAAETPVLIRYRDPAPPAGAHVYSCRAWTTASNGGTIQAGPGGQNQLAPGYLRVISDG